MQVNMDKSKIIFFRSGGVIRANEKWFYNKEIMEIVTYYKYLELFYSRRLNLSFVIQSLCSQSMKAINMFKMLNGKCHGLPYSVVFNIFDTTVLPVLIYASEVWGYNLHQNVVNVQICFCRYLDGVGPGLQMLKYSVNVVVCQYFYILI